MTSGPLPVRGSEGPCGGQPEPDAPRLVEKWNGYAWESHEIAMNLAEAQRLLRSRDEGPPTAESLRSQPLCARRGRRRKAPAW
ncbi:DUF6087 family protein [Streptomyces cucumeris]|uniref:DUF6087 family protein n=1 Tax=Streptomyces cucumeris TaxID=2962890 RepID=UPI003D72A249